MTFLEEKEKKALKIGKYGIGNKIQFFFLNFKLFL